MCNLSNMSAMLSPPVTGASDMDTTGGTGAGKRGNVKDQDIEDEEENEEDDAEEALVATLPKHKTPLHRLPYHEREIDPDMKSALQELAQADTGRAEAALESMRGSLNGHTVKELKEELKERGLKVTGRKSELVDRLLEWHRENGQARGSCQVM